MWSQIVNCGDRISDLYTLSDKSFFFFAIVTVGLIVAVDIVVGIVAIPIIVVVCVVVVSVTIIIVVIGAVPPLKRQS